MFVESFSKGEHHQMFALLNSVEPNPEKEIIVTGLNATVYMNEIEEATNTKYSTMLRF